MPNPSMRWPKIIRNVREWPNHIPQLRHIRTRVFNPDTTRGPRCGRVLWGAPTEGGLLAVAWNWQELDERLIVLVDPLAVFSNVLLRDEHQRSLDEAQRLLHLHSAIYTLPWQQAICSHSADRSDLAA